MVYIRKKEPNIIKIYLIKLDTDLNLNIFKEIENSNKEKRLKILDFGYGDGILFQQLVDAGYQFFLVDIYQDSFKAHITFIILDFNNEKKVKSFIEKYKRFILISIFNITLCLRFYFLIYGWFHKFMANNILYGLINSNLLQIEYIFKNLNIKLYSQRPVGILSYFYSINEEKWRI